VASSWCSYLLIHEAKLNEYRSSCMSPTSAEDASFRYTAINSHEGLAHMGIHDTVVAKVELPGDRGPRPTDRFPFSCSNH